MSEQTASAQNRPQNSLAATLAEKPLRAAILALALPVMAEQILATVTQVVDMAMVGRLGAESIAAVGVSMQPFMLAMSLFSAVSVGNTALVARFIGAGEPDNASRTLTQSLLIAAIFAGLIAVIGFLFAPQLVNIMNPETDVLELAVRYVRFMMPGIFFMLSSMMITGSLRGAGDTRTPMKVNMMINILNPILNWLLIFGNLGFPRMGVAGAALATTIARSVGGLTFVYIIFSGRRVLHIRKEHLRRGFDWPLIKRMLNIGLPAAVEQLITRSGQILYARTVSGLGTVLYAAHQVTINAESISYMPGFGFSAAATTLVGQNLGAKNPQRASQAGREAWKLGATLMGAMGVLLFLIPGLLMRIYTDDPDVIMYGSQCLRIAAFSQIPMGTSFIMSGALRGAGDTRFMLFVSTASVWFVRLGLSLLFINVFGWSLAGAWLAQLMDWVVRGGVAFLRFRSGKWATIKV